MKTYYFDDFSVAKTYYDGNLDLRKSSIKMLPDNLTVDGSLDLSDTQIETLPDNLTVGGWLDLSDTRIESIPDSLIVGDHLNLRDTLIATLPDNPAVGGWINLRGTSIESLPENLKIAGSLSLRETLIEVLPENLKIGGTLDLNDTRIESIPDSLIVGDHLNLCHTSITALPNSLTVGGFLDLRNTPIESLPDNLTVGGWLDLRQTSIKSLPNSLKVGGKICKWDKPEVMREMNEKVTYLKDGDYVPGHYIYADGILTHIQKERKVDGYTLYVGKIKGHNVVSDGEYYAHCDNFRDGIADIIFKRAKDRGAEQYKSLTLDSMVKTEDAITMYRIITGACRAGTQDFLDNYISAHGPLKESYSVREIMDCTDGHYGSDKFKEFFEALT